MVQGSNRLLHERVVTVRVDDETRKKMSQMRHVNWSSVLRDTIDKKIREESNRDLARAVLLTDKVRKKGPFQLE